MGNGVTKLGGGCCAAAGEISRRHDIAVNLSDEGLGHSFCYVRPEPYRFSSSSKVHSEDAAGQTTPFFRSISGAAVSANTSTPLSTSLIDACPYSSSAAFESSTCFASVPLQPVPRPPEGNSGSISGERGFLSGPIERGFASGPIETNGEKIGFRDINGKTNNDRFKKLGLIKVLRRAITTISGSHNSIQEAVSIKGSDSERNNVTVISSTNLSSQFSFNSDSYSMESQNLQWAQGKAGEDRMQVVISEEHGWVFVGIYDGFNGPDAPDYLLTNLYTCVHKELKGLLWNDEKVESLVANAKKWKCEWDSKEQRSCPGSNCGEGVNHSDVLEVLSRALERTEEAYLEAADEMVMENPELALMGSCVLVMLMKGEDVYLMNVGDSRAVLGRKSRTRRGFRNDLEEVERHEPCLSSFQLTRDHSTYEEEEVWRIKNEHPDDDSAVMNERVKGYLKVTRAFGAGFLKQPKWNNALLEMFRIDYIGTSPYITCDPWLYHHKLGPRDGFLILSSDGLYQYFTNEEAVSEVESFLASFPDGDPAQHLIEELLFRAAKKAGLDFHELLDIPQGDRRRYHDDVSIIIISLEGRIWRSSV